MYWGMLFHVPFILMVAFVINAFSDQLVKKGISPKWYYPFLLFASTSVYLLLFSVFSLIEFRDAPF